ncbi:uncharacterized protein LOC131941960 [Physella acuta]|uniref:uncharacterized protein LOC131941960 n=1 Tax=Physella acuta TaxID=109671 RepID=UPI0027DE4F25|nr:uncharacterized protein LOC131941960 [Physella acuta]
MEDDDEEVIFENSVLHKALIENGYTDFETVPRSSNTSDQSKGEDDKFINSQPGCERKSYTYKVDWMSRLLLPPSLLNELHEKHQHQTLRGLISSNLLSEEDKSFLEYFIDDAPTEQVKNRFWIVPILVLLLVTLAVVNAMRFSGVISHWLIMLCKGFPSLMFIFPYRELLSTLLAHLLCLFVFALALAYLRSRAYKKVLAELEDKVKCVADLQQEAWELMHLEKKCLRLVKESELVARGFTFATQLYATSGRRLDQLSCLELRQALLDENLALMAILKTCVGNMMTNLPMICKDSDYNTLDTLVSDLVNDTRQHDDQWNKLLGDGLQAAMCSQSNMGVVSPAQLTALYTYVSYLRSENGLDYVTDNSNFLNLSFTESLTDSEHHCVFNLFLILVKCVDLVNVHISGLLRRLVLCFYSQNFQDRSINPFTASAACVLEAKKAFQKARSSLTRTHNYSRAIHISKSEESSQPKMNPANKTQLSNLHGCIKSLNLHVQSMHTLTKNMLEALEEKVDDEARRIEAGEKLGSTLNISMEEREMWDVDLKLMSARLDFCNTCHEEAVKIMHHKHVVVSVLDEPVRPSAYRNVIINQPYARAAEDYINVDQVLVGTGDGDDPWDSRPIYTAEEKVLRRETRDQMRRDGPVKLRPSLTPVAGDISLVDEEETSEKVKVMVSVKALTKHRHSDQLIFKMDTSGSDPSSHSSKFSVGDDSGSLPSSTASNPEETAISSAMEIVVEKPSAAAAVSSADEKKLRAKQKKQAKLLKFQAGGVSDIERQDRSYWSRCRRMINVDSTSTSTGSTGSFSPPNERTAPDLDLSAGLSTTLTLNRPSGLSPPRQRDTFMGIFGPQVLATPSQMVGPQRQDTSSEAVGPQSLDAYARQLACQALDEYNKFLATCKPAASTDALASDVNCPLKINSDEESFRLLYDAKASGHNFTASSMEARNLQAPGGLLQRSLAPLALGGANYQPEEYDSDNGEKIPRSEAVLDKDGKPEVFGQQDANARGVAANRTPSPDRDFNIRGVPANPTPSPDRDYNIRGAPANPTPSPDRDYNIRGVPANPTLSPDRDYNTRGAQANPIPSPERVSSFNQSVAILAAQKAKAFIAAGMEEEQFGDVSSDSS